MSATQLRPVAESGRTNVLSELEQARVLLFDRRFHQVAAALAYKKDDDLVEGHRNRDYPKSIVLLFGVLSRVCRSQPRAEAFFRPPDMWQLIRRYWEQAYALGIIPSEEPSQLPNKPIKVGQWRYALKMLETEPGAFAAVEAAFVNASVDLALSLGYFSTGSFTNPAKSSCLFADGTEIRSQYRSHIEKRWDEKTGKKRRAAIDPQAKDRVRAWLVSDDAGRWRAIDPDTGEVKRKLPVDPEALASAKYGPTQSAYNVVPLSVRGDTPHSRVTIWIGIDESENTEAATIMRGIDRIDEVLHGKVQCLITDMIIRGTHQNTLFTKYGIIPITKVAASGSGEVVTDTSTDGSDNSVTVTTSRKGKKVKSLPLVRQKHTVMGNKVCSHQLMLVDGAVVEVDYDETGRDFVEISRPKKVQVKRSARKTEERPYSFSDGYCITCPHGDFTVWLCPHQRIGADDGRKMAENFRVFPEGSPQFIELYGAGRNTSEGGNAHHKNSYPHKRSQSSGRIAMNLDVILYFIADNSRTWYFQTGFKIVDAVLQGDPIPAITTAAAALTSTAA